MATSGIEALIAEKLMATLKAQSYDSLPYAWPEITFDPKTTPKYIAVDVIFNNHGFQSQRDAIERMGLFQAMVVYPKDKGIILPLQTASAIVAAWPPTTVLYTTGVKIVISPSPWVGNQDSDATRIRYPVYIPWKAYTN